MPLIIKLPPKLQKKYPQGLTSNRVVSLVDIFPTLNELCGLSQPKQNFDGKSLIPLLVNPEKEWDSHAISMYGKDNYSLRTENYRYIRYENGAEELYNHDNDPYEWNNLAGKPAYSKIKKQLADKLPKESKPYVKTEPFDWQKYQREVLRKVKKQNLYDRVKPEWD